MNLIENVRLFGHSRFAIVGCLLLVLACGCQQEMARQPSYRPWEPSPFFADGQADRPVEPGTIARGQLRDNRWLVEADGARAAEAVAVLAAGASPLGTLALAAVSAPPPADSFPFALTEDMLQRGRLQFNIYCAVCHDRIGTGNGRIVQRGYVRPPSFHSERLRQAPAAHYFRVITRGQGAMPDYSAQIAPADRWDIVAYIRALQLSQDAPVDALPPAIRRQLVQER
ncbi:MAG: cytochrome c [Gemmataceae bacterium]|nr:cytochrome c [Gemmataceae bacterium]